VFQKGLHSFQNLYTSILIIFKNKKPIALAREQTVATERPPPVGEVTANVCE
jgi:hypothetical protein